MEISGIVLLFLPHTKNTRFFMEIFLLLILLGTNHLTVLDRLYILTNYFPDFDGKISGRVRTEKTEPIKSASVKCNCLLSTGLDKNYQRSKRQKKESNEAELSRRHHHHHISEIQWSV